MDFDADELDRAEMWLASAVRDGRCVEEAHQMLELVKGRVIRSGRPRAIMPPDPSTRPPRQWRDADNRVRGQRL